jgi:putative transposase
MSSPDDLDDPRLLLALLRYRMIAEALEAPKGERAALLRKVASREHTRPDGTPLHVTVRTLERWIARYTTGHLKALVRAHRADARTLRAFPQAALDRAIALRKEVGGRSTPTLIDALERAGEIAPGALKRSTLDRHLDRHEASRRRLGLLGQKRHVRLHFENPLDFVVADFHAGPYVRTASSEVRRAELSAFIDHASRYVPESRYGLTEDLAHVRRGVRAFCTAWGLPRRLYVDNGPGYQAERFHFGCAELGIDLCHSKPYVSEGRGVIERFNRTVKEAFELEVRMRAEPPTLEELNTFWRAWIEERYHRTAHSETGEPPITRWERLYPGIAARRADPVLLDELLRVRARRTVHAKTSTVEVGGVPFVVTPSLRRRRVDVLWDPHDLSSVLIYFDGRRIERAVPQQPGEAPVSAPIPGAPPAITLDYLELLRRDHARRRLENTSTIRFRTTPDTSAPLTLARLLEQITTCTGRALGDVERAHVAGVLEGLAPLEIALADTALKIAVAQLGHGLHAAQYLAALREHVLASRQKGTTR